MNTMKKFNLPKGYLSYSAIDTWIKNPEQYRRRYYENEEFPMTPELTFGKKIAELLEVNDPSVAHIPRYNKPEQSIKCTIDEVPVFGFIDDFDTREHRFREYKTGKTPWTEDRVLKHKQLDLYSLAIEAIYGSVVDLCHLVWMQTERVETPHSGRITHADQYGIKMTGEVKIFPREITKDDRLHMRWLLRSVAEEISNDYTEYLEKKNAAPKGGRVSV